MKKILPIVLWIASYFVWVHSAQYLQGDAITAKGLWWGLSDVFLGVVTLGTTMIAINE